MTSIATSASTEEANMFDAATMLWAPLSIVDSAFIVTVSSLRVTEGEKKWLLVLVQKE